jgi:DNA repair exonuclease SbcCD ATPase subunit
MSELTVSVEGVGGIDERSVTIDDGVTLVAGPNASNKTSLLEGIAFGLGVDDVPIKTDREAASVTLEIDDRTVTRTATRTDAGTRIEGDAWIESADAREAFSTFGHLVELNPLRAAIRSGRSVEDELKEPVNVEALEREREEKLARKREAQSRIQEIGDVEEKIRRRESELEEKRDRVDALEADLEALYDERDADDEEDEQLSELQDRQRELASERDRTQRQIEDAEATVEELEERRDELDAEIAEIEDELEDADVEALERERSTLRDEQVEIRERIDVLTAVVSANREVANANLVDALGRDSGLMGDQVTCFTCGQEAPRETVAEPLDDLVELLEDERQRLTEHEPRIEELTEEIEAIEERRRRASELRRERTDVDRRLTDRRESLETKREALVEVREELADVEDEIATVEAEATDSEDLAAEIEETRVELTTVRRDADRIEERLDELRDRVRERERLETEVDELGEAVAELTDRIESLEDDLRTAFGDAMDDLLEALAFERIERIWLDGNFDVVVAREVDGTVRRDVVEHLSESERETVGLVLALAGYLVHDVDEEAPVLLLDSLDAFDAKRTAALLEFFGERTDFELAAVLPETAADLDIDAVDMGSQTQPAD